MSGAGRFSLRRSRVVDGRGGHEVGEELVDGRVDLVKEEGDEDGGDQERHDDADECFDGVDQIASFVLGGVEDLADRGHYVTRPSGCRNENRLHAVPN